MTRLNLTLFFVLIAVALGVVTSQHKARNLYIELERASQSAKQTEQEYGQLQLEQSTWANPARVDTLARTQLGLIPPAQERIRVEAGQAESWRGSP